MTTNKHEPRSSLSESSIGGSRSDLRQTLMGVRSLVTDNILDRWPDARILFAASSPDCNGQPHRWKLWRRIRADGREVHIDCCEHCRSCRVQNAARHRSESARSVYVRRTLFYVTTRSAAPNE